MSSAQEKVLIAVTVALFVDAFTRTTNDLLPLMVLWLMNLVNH